MQGGLNLKILKKKHGSKRGFSAIIASLILMLLAVAAGVVVYAYVMGWIGGATTNPRQTGHLSFDTMYANTTAKTINVAVRNVGGTNLLLSNIYIAGVDVTANCAPAIPATGYTLNVQAVVLLTLSNVNMTVGSYPNVLVACKDGTQISQSVPAQ
jgi:hypothetical protein